VVERDLACCGNCPLQAPQRRCSHSLVGGELQETDPCFFVWFDSLSCFSSINDLLPLWSTWVCYLGVQGSLSCLWSSTKSAHQVWFVLEIKRCLKLFLQVLCATPAWPVSPVKSSAWPIWPVITTGLTGGTLSAQVFREKEFNLVVTPIQPPLGDIKVLLGRSCWCGRPCTPPRLESRRPSFPRTRLGWMGYVVVMSVWSKGCEKKHLDPWAHLYMHPTATTKQSWALPISGGALYSLE
jgi:hypothetical protein